MKRLSEREIFERSISEEDVIGAMRALLELNGARVHRIVERIPWGKTTSTPGIPDITGWWPEDTPKAIATGGWPIHFFIEAKRKGGKLRPAQEAWIRQAREDGVICFMADSVEAMVKGFSEYGIILKGLQ